MQSQAFRRMIDVIGQDMYYRRGAEDTEIEFFFVCPDNIETNENHQSAASGAKTTTFPRRGRLFADHLALKILIDRTQ